MKKKNQTSFWSKSANGSSGSGSTKRSGSAIISLCKNTNIQEFEGQSRSDTSAIVSVWWHIAEYLKLAFHMSPEERFCNSLRDKAALQPSYDHPEVVKHSRSQ